MFKVAVVNLIGGIFTNAIYDALKSIVPRYRDKTKNKNQIEKSVKRAIEPLMPFLENEKISEEQRRLLIATCVKELRLSMRDSKLPFRCSLNSRKIFDSFYAERDLPYYIVEHDLQGVYASLFTHATTLLCETSITNSQAWAESYRRQDELKKLLRNQPETLQPETFYMDYP